MKRILLSRLSILMLALLPTLAGAANGTVKGKLLDENGLPLPGATILLTDLEGVGTITDVSGNFTLLNVPEGKHQIKISYIGYKTYETEIDVTGGVVALKYNLEPGVIIGDEILVLGDRLKGQAKALNEQRTKDNITNIIAADQIGRFPDANIGDALKRVPGITMQGDQGEARNIVVRGLAPQLNSVTINGNRIPSAEGDNRNIQMDLIPANMIQAIEVNKAILPEMDGDAIGGSVNLVTRSAGEGFRVSGTLAGSYNQVGDAAGYNGGLVLSNRFFNNRLGAVLSGSYRNDRIGSHNVKAEWENEVEDDDSGEDISVDPYLAVNEIRDYDVDRTRRSISLNLDYSINDNHTIYAKSMYNWRDDWENRYRLTTEIDKAVFGNGVNAEPTEWIVVADRQTKGGIDDDRNKKTRLEDQRVQSYSLNGEHLFGNVQATWMGSFSKASEERPHERYIKYESDNDLSANMNASMMDTRKPLLVINEPSLLRTSNFVFDKIEEEFQLTEEENYTAQIDFRIPVSAIEGQAGNIKFGTKFNKKTKDRNNGFTEYAWVDGTPVEYLSQIETDNRTNSDFLVGNKFEAGRFASTAYLGNLNLYNTNLFEAEDKPDEYQTANYDAEENVTAGYVQWTQNFTDELRIIAGARVENTSSNYIGYQFVEDDESVNSLENEMSYLNFLPAIHARYAVNDNLIIRAAWTNSLARPNYYDLVPYRYVVEEDEEISQGNPDLDPTTSMNFDLNAEYYFETIGLISAGVFHKSIDNFVYFQRSTEDYNGSDFDVLTPQNSGKGKITGFEIAAQRQLDFLPGIWKGVGVYANYTFNASDVDGIANEDGDAREGLDLPGTADHMFNASLSFETARLVVRGSLNFSSDYIDEVGDDEFYDRYYDKQLFIDLNASYAFTPNLRLFAEANNLTNQPLRYYQGIESRTMQVEYYGPKYNVGVKFDLFNK